MLVRKHEPKPLRIHLQSGEGDNNLYCGDWWMANQMMERSLTWNGYDVRHTWGTGGHNQKHATAIFPDVLRGLWKGYPEEPVKANPRGDSKWRGYEVVGDGEWEILASVLKSFNLESDAQGDVWVWDYGPKIERVASPGGKRSSIEFGEYQVHSLVSHRKGIIALTYRPTSSTKGEDKRAHIIIEGQPHDFLLFENNLTWEYASSYSEWLFGLEPDGLFSLKLAEQRKTIAWPITNPAGRGQPSSAVLSPDQTTLFVSTYGRPEVWAVKVEADGKLNHICPFGQLTEFDSSHSLNGAQGVCVDTNGWLYVATSLGIQVLDQAGRVNFIIPTPKQPHDVCFGGKDLSELFIACGDAIYKRPTKAKGYISGQMAPIKPPPPKL